MKRALIALTALGLLSGCGIFNGSERRNTPTVGTRIPVLATESRIEVDPTLAGVPVAVPGPALNANWPQPGGNPSHSMGHVALPTALQQAWSVSIGSGSSNKARLAAEPVVADGRVYATNGAGDAAALDAATGALVWLVKPGGPLRGAPTVANENVYAVSQDNQLYALNTANGETRWTGTGAFELAGVFGAAAPAFSQSTIVAGYSSGELTAYRYENGQVVWQDALARTGVSTIVGTISDIDADPVIDEGRVFAVGQGGRMVAVELITGQRVWELNIAGISTPWAAGEWVFVVTDRAQLLALSRASGRVRWISQLPGFRDPEDEQGPIFWRGPVLAGNRLVLTSSSGHIAHVSPTDGTVVSMVSARAPISLPPVVANNTLYVLDDTGRLTAWR